VKYLFDSQITKMQCCPKNITFIIFQNKNHFSYTMKTSWFIYQCVTCNDHYRNKN